MDRPTKILIASLFVPGFMIGTDFTGAMMLALPIEREFSADITTTQWVLNVYALTLGMTCVAGGRLGDIYGRRRVLLIGLVVFLLSSLVCTIAPTIGWLIGARAVQGVGAAMVWPCVLAIAATSVKPEERGVVMGLLLGAVATGNVVAPFVAGVLGGLGIWRGFFLFNVLMAALSLFMLLRIPRIAHEPTDERVDYPGIMALSLAVLALLFGLDVGAEWGWASPQVIGLFAGAVLLFIAFIFAESRVPDPTIPPSMMRNGQFMMALSTNGMVAPTIFIIFLYMPQYLHKALGWSTLWASIGTLPILVSLAIVNLTAGQLYNRAGPRRLLAFGHVLILIAAIWLAILKPSWGYLGTVVPMLLAGIGGGFIIGPAGTATVNAADPSRAGLAGGLGFMFHLMIGAVGVAAATALVFVGSLSSLAGRLTSIGANMSTADQMTINGSAVSGSAVRDILDRFDPTVAREIGVAVSGAFADGLQMAYWLVAAFAAGGLIISLHLSDARLRHPAT